MDIHWISTGIAYSINIYLIYKRIYFETTKFKREQMKTTTKKGILINLDAVTREYLRSLAETNSSSMSQEVRRLILDEKKRTDRGREK